MDDRSAFKTIGRAIRHRIYVLIAIVGLCMLGAGVAAVVRPPVYQGTALLLVDQRANSSQVIDLQTGELLSAHFTQTATSEPVLQLACSGAYFTPPAAFSCSATALASRVNATTVRGTDWIGVSVTASSASEAAALTNAIAHAMIDQNKADIERLMAPTHDDLQSQLNSLSAAIAAEQAEIARIANQPDKAGVLAADQAQLSSDLSEYATTSAKLQDLQLEQDKLSASLSVYQPAAIPTKPIDPDPLRYLVVGLVGGLCLGLAAAVLLDRFDDRVFEADTLSLAVGSRFVVDVTEDAALNGTGADLYTVAYAKLFAYHPHTRKLLLVAASQRDRVRPVAAGIGMASVNAGQKVLVVDAEAHSYVMQQESGKNGARMTIVSSPNNDRSDAAKEALADADHRYDLTIMSAPSPDRDPTAIVEARLADVAIVVATTRTTRFSDARRTAESLRQAGVQVLGSIFVIRTSPPKDEELDRSSAYLYEVAANQWRLPTWRGPGK